MHESRFRQAEIGGPAPAVHLHLRDGEPITLAAFGGQPLVIAFLDAGQAPGSWQQDILRAEARGLGAALLVLSCDGVWCFDPDERLHRFARGADLDPGDVAETRQRFGLAPRPDSDGPDGGLFVIDGDLAVRFAYRAPAPARPAGPSAAAPEATLAGLVDALTLARRTLLDRRPTRFLLSRREMVVTCLCGALAAYLFDGAGRAAAAAPTAAAPPAGEPDEVEITLHVNGGARKVRVDARVTLLDALRERLGLTGTKKGCDHGQCGACTVLVDGRRVNACLTLAVMADRAPITTIEGVAHGDELHPLQAAFVAEDALQCGYCTPGQIMSGLGLLREGHAQTDDEIREAMSGNVCRCAAYPNIVAAIQRARKEA